MLQPEVLVRRAHERFDAEGNLTAEKVRAVPKTNVLAIFEDVPTTYFSWRFIESLVIEGVTSGCGSGKFCPSGLVNRAQSAVFLLAARDGILPPPAEARHNTPPPATGTLFTDVPANYWAARWIEQLAAQGITGGCGGGKYCPDQPITRGEMAVFIVKVFDLPLP